MVKFLSYFSNRIFRVMDCMSWHNLDQHDVKQICLPRSSEIFEMKFMYVYCIYIIYIYIIYYIYILYIQMKCIIYYIYYTYK